MPRIGINPRDIAAIQGGIDPDAILGYLLWYSVADVRIPRDDLEALFQQIGLDLVDPRLVLLCFGDKPLAAISYQVRVAHPHVGIVVIEPNLGLGPTDHLALWGIEGQEGK